MSLVHSPRARTLVMLSWVAAATVGGAAVTHAQRDKCDVQDDNSSDLMGAHLFLGRATDPKNTNQAQKDSLLRQGVASLTASKFNEQKELGRDFLLGEALSLEAANPNINPVGPRGSYGFKTDSASTIDIIAKADTLMNIIASKKKECQDLADRVRQQAYVPLTNAALSDLNSKNYAQADTLARRALEIYTKSPYAYSALGSVDITKQDYPGAKENFQKVISLSGTDTTYRKLKDIAMYNLAVVSSTIADDSAKSPNHKMLADSAVVAWKAYQQADPSNPNAQAGLTHALQASGDTAQANALYSDMINNPSKYTDQQLFQSAIAAAQAKDENAAVKLFSLGLKTNPYFSTALYYVANSEFNNGQVDSLMPTIRRLVSIDPNNPDAYRILAGAYQLRARDATDPKLKRAYQDSIVVALKKYQQPKVGVTVTNFADDGQHVSVSGRIQNFTDSSHTYTPQFSFIDPQGNVVGTKGSSPVTVGPKQTGTFQLSTDARGAVAYKYAPLD